MSDEAARAGNQHFGLISHGSRLRRRPYSVPRRATPPKWDGDRLATRMPRRMRATIHRLAGVRPITSRQSRVILLKTEHTQCSLFGRRARWSGARKMVAVWIRAEELCPTGRTGKRPPDPTGQAERASSDYKAGRLLRSTALRSLARAYILDCLEAARPSLAC